MFTELISFGEHRVRRIDRFGEHRVRRIDRFWRTLRSSNHSVSVNIEFAESIGLVNIVFAESTGFGERSVH